MQVKIPREIQVWPIADLIPYQRNAKLHPESQVNAVAASIVEFGFTKPILIDTEKGIVAGHCRVQAARKLGLTEVPVVVLDHLSPEQVRAYRIADNKLGESGWDAEALNEELDELQALDFDLSLTGFTGFELDDILREPGSQRQEETESGPSRETRKVEVALADLIFTLGEYRIPIERERYLRWQEEIRQSNGFDQKSVIAEILRRLAI